jgi:hypothetical protein
LNVESAPQARGEKSANSGGISITSVTARMTTF